MTAEGRPETGSTADQCDDGSGAESGEEPVDGEGRDHLSDVPVGSGCTEIWEHLAERREDDG